MMDTTSMDLSTAKIAFQLQLNDIDDLLDGLYDEDELPLGDTRTSFEVLRSDLQQQLAILEGQTLTLRILKKEHENRLIFARLLEEEERAVSDHQLSIRLAGVSVSKPVTKRSGDYLAVLSDIGNDEQWEMAKELYAEVSEHDVEDRAPLNGIRTVKAVQVEANSKSKILGSKALTKCSVCFEVVSSKNSLTLKCKPEVHTYCRACLVDLFVSTLEDVALFPPRCCKLPIPFDVCRVILPKELTKKFDLKVEELATPNPTYCYKAECSMFIRPKDIKADVATCVFQDCEEKTCVRCKCKAHNGLCPEDPHVQLLMDFAKRGKWQQCTKCKNMVELSQGCFHMICRCNNEFCYLCGAKWKTCSCPRADEEYLTREVPPVPAPVVQDTFDPDLHEHTWRRVRGADCQGCRSTWLSFIMRCDGCNVDNCWTCINNRD